MTKTFVFGRRGKWCAVFDRYALLLLGSQSGREGLGSYNLSLVCILVIELGAFV